MQKLATLSLVFVLALMTLSAEEGKKEKKAKVKKEKPVPEEISLVGTLVKNEQPPAAAEEAPADGEKKKKKKVKKLPPFSLTLEDGTSVMIPKNATKKNNVDLEPFVDKKITLKFSGFKKTKKEKTTYMIKTIISAEVAAAE